VNALSSLREKLERSKGYRESFAASVVKRMIPLQIRILRKQREWSQAQLAKESKLTQGVISRAEDPDYGNLTVNTLMRIAGGFDCAYVGRFVPFSDLGKWYNALTDEKSLEVQSFKEDLGFVERKGPCSTMTWESVEADVGVGEMQFVSDIKLDPGNVIAMPPPTIPVQLGEKMHA
jgi:transcriptional regulator with XRE-family HTH domain